MGESRQSGLTFDMRGMTRLAGVCLLMEGLGCIGVLHQKLCQGGHKSFFSAEHLLTNGKLVG